MKTTKRQLKSRIQKKLVEAPVGTTDEKLSKQRPHLQVLAEEIDSVFQTWGIDAQVKLFNSGYVGISVSFVNATGTPQKWLVVDQPGVVGPEDQAMGYIFFGPGGKAIQQSNAWVWEQVPYFGRKFGDASMADDIRDEVYETIIDTIDNILQEPDMAIADTNESITKISKRQLRRVIKEVMEQPQLHMSGRHQNVMTQLHTAIDALIDTLGNEEARQELLGIVEDWNTEAHHENY